MNRRAFIFMAAAALAAVFTSSTAFAQGTLKKAPQWDIAEWLNSDGLSLDQLRGKVVVVDFFQMWCPGCKSFSMPLMEHWEKEVFSGEVEGDQLVFVSIHTVFEGHAYQTPKRLRGFIKEKGITHPVGIDRHDEGKRVPETMERYRTMGTPEMAIIDKRGNIRFQRFGYFKPEFGEELIRQLLDERVEARAGEGLLIR